MEIFINKSVFVYFWWWIEFVTSTHIHTHTHTHNYLFCCCSFLVNLGAAVAVAALKATIVYMLCVVNLQSGILPIIFCCFRVPIQIQLTCAKQSFHSVVVWIWFQPYKLSSVILRLLQLCFILGDGQEAAAETKFRGGNVCRWARFFANCFYLVARHIGVYSCISVWSASM